MPHSLPVSDGVLAKIAALRLWWCFGGLRPTTGGGGRRWEPEPREPSSHRHSYLRLQLVQGGSGLTYVFFRWLFLFLYFLVGCFLFFLVPYFLPTESHKYSSYVSN